MSASGHTHLLLWWGMLIAWVVVHVPGQRTLQTSHLSLPASRQFRSTVFSEHTDFRVQNSPRQSLEPPSPHAHVLAQSPWCLRIWNTHTHLRPYPAPRSYEVEYPGTVMSTEVWSRVPLCILLSGGRKDPPGSHATHTLPGAS